MQDELVLPVETGATQFAVFRSRPRAMAPAVVQDQRSLAVVVAVVHVLQTLLVLANATAELPRDQTDHVLVPNVADLRSIRGRAGWWLVTDIQRRGIQFRVQR